MVIQLDLPQIISLLVAIVGGLFTVCKIVLSHIDGRFAKLENDEKEYIKDCRRIDRELLELKATLPMDYQRRDDANRTNAEISMKLDGLANKISELRVTGRQGV